MQNKDFKLIDLVTYKKSSGFLIWNYKTSFHWTGMEFDDLRQYSIGDDVHSIDWLSSAKQDKIYIKKYKEERELPVLFVFALSSTMQFWYDWITKLDTVINTFLPLALSSLKNNNPIGSIFYNDAVIDSFEPKKWQINIYKILKTLNWFKQENTWKQSNYLSVMEYLFKKKLKNNLIFLFTDETNIEWNTLLKAISIKNDLIYINISDDFENTLSWESLINLSLWNKSLNINLNNQNKKLNYVRQRNLELENLKKIIISSWWSYIWIDNKSNILKILYNFFKLRQKQK